MANSTKESFSGEEKKGWPNAKKKKIKGEKASAISENAFVVETRGLLVGKREVAVQAVRFSLTSMSKFS